jgi:hypothetical protein
VVESQPSKLLVAGSIPVSRSRLSTERDARIEKARIERNDELRTKFADVAQLAERVLGKDEVTGPIPVIGSRQKVPNIF